MRKVIQMVFNNTVHINNVTTIILKQLARWARTTEACVKRNNHNWYSTNARLCAGNLHLVFSLNLNHLTL